MVVLPADKGNFCFIHFAPQLFCGDHRIGKLLRRDEHFTPPSPPAGGYGGRRPDFVKEYGGQCNKELPPF
jgi:hypothetical protein